MDFKYIFIRLLQNIVKLQNRFKKLFAKNEKISLKWDEHILLIKLDRIWDAIWGVQIAKLIKHYYPNIKIDIICNDYNYFVFKENKYLFNKILSIRDFPPSYLVKNFFKLPFILYEIFSPLIKNYHIFKNLKQKSYDIIIDTTSRKWFLIRKFLKAKHIIKCDFHKEIGTSIPWCWVLEKLNLKPTKIINYSKKTNNELNFLIFIGGKKPNKLEINFRKKLIKLLAKNQIDFSILVDNTKDYNYRKDLNNKVFLLKLEWIFKVNNLTFKKFLKNFHFFISWDWWVFHYASLYLPSLGIYTATNPFAVDYIILLEKYKNIFLFKSQLKNTFYVSKLLPCIWCFQIWCMLKNCWKFLDIELNFVIKKIKIYLNN